jgi:hypothetical protein
MLYSQTYDYMLSDSMWQLKKQLAAHERNGIDRNSYNNS